MSGSGKKKAIAIIIKTPGISPVKTRLSTSTGVGFSDRFYRRCLEIVSTVVQEAVKWDSKIEPFWAVAEDECTQHDIWKVFKTISQGDGGLGERMGRVHNLLVGEYESVVLIGADIPLITRTHVRDAFEILSVNRLCKDKNNMVIGPAIDGGFYLFGASCKIPRDIWTRVKYSVSTTCQKFKSSLGSLGNIFDLSVLSDVDTLQDLFRLTNTGNHQKGLMTCQRNLIDWTKDYIETQPRLVEAYNDYINLED